MDSWSWLRPCSLIVTVALYDRFLGWRRSRHLQLAATVMLGVILGQLLDDAVGGAWLAAGMWLWRSLEWRLVFGHTPSGYLRTPAAFAGHLVLLAIGLLPPLIWLQAPAWASIFWLSAFSFVATGLEYASRLITGSEEHERRQLIGALELQRGATLGAIFGLILGLF